MRQISRTGLARHSRGIVPPPTVIARSKATKQFRSERSELVGAQPGHSLSVSPCQRSDHRLLLMSLTIATLACGSDGNHRPSIAATVPICAEVDRGEWTPGSETVIVDDPSPPCRLTLDTTVVRSYSAAEADSLDLSRVREVDRHGNFYVQGYEHGVITVLSPSGDLISRFGREGPGPGELPSGHLGVEVSARDSIYVQDNRLRWTVFGPDRQFVRSMPLGAIQAGTYMRCVLSDGSIISSAAIHGGTRPVTLRLFDPSGEIVAEFGRVDNDVSANSAALSREVSCALDNAAWALPSPIEPGYRLERWGPDGKLLNVVTREASWFDAGPPMTLGEALTSRPPSAVRQVFEAHRGLLYTMVVSADPRWEPITRSEWEARKARMFDVRFEALDAISGRLLAFLLVDDQSTLPNARIMRNGHSYELVVNDSGGVRLTAYTLHLVSR